MVAQPVEWALIVYYGPEAHRATYGRQVRSNRYTKDYIQLSRKPEFLETVTKLFSITAGETGSVPITYMWPGATAAGHFVFNSSDRPHLKWGTSVGAPQVWKMAVSPSDATQETIPGDPTHLNFDDAENEFALLESRGAGQPYLMAIKLRDEPRTLHLRVYLGDPSQDFNWAGIGLVPTEIQALAEETSRQSALAWRLFQSGGIAPTTAVDEALSRIAESSSPAPVIDTLDLDAGRSLISYLQNPGYGVFFDPSRNHDAWIQVAPLSTQVAASVDELLQVLEARFPEIPQGDAAAENMEASSEEVEAYRQQITQKSYAVPDSTATVKTRGSAQRAFADAVKTNYGLKCAITGVATKDFLVASHIVPWSEDQDIRLDPSNGICLSLFVDRAFEKGYLKIEDDYTIQIDLARIGDDHMLRNQLEPYNGQALNQPTKEPPQVNYLRRRRALITPST